MPISLVGPAGVSGTNGANGATPVVVTSAAALPGSPVDGQPAIVRVGSGSGTEDILLIYNSTRSKWVGQKELCLIRMTDNSVLKITSPVAGQWKYFPGSGTGWGMVSPKSVGASYTAGLSLEYREQAFLQKGGAIDMNVMTYFYGFNSDDLTTITAFNTPPNTGLLGTTYLPGLTGGAAASALMWKERDWSALNWTTTPTKSGLYAACYGMVASGSTSGGVADYSFFVRWVV